jgi:DNA-binding response OmpR family regulator
MMAPRVVAFDTSPDYRAVLGCLLEASDGYDVSICETYDQLREALNGRPPSLVIVNFADIPEGEDGLTELRRGTEAPLMALVASPDETKAALRGGADYDLPKPFDPEIFAVAAEAVLRRNTATPVALLANSVPLAVGDLKVYPERRTVERDGRRQVLSPTEWQLFAFLAANPGRIFSRRELAAGAWGPGYTSRSGQAELYISRVRRKVERDVHRPRLIETVRGRGYRLTAEVRHAAAG